jgi:hypothetical protein
MALSLRRAAVSGAPALLARNFRSIGITAAAYAPGGAPSGGDAPSAGGARRNPVTLVFKKVDDDYEATAAKANRVKATQDFQASSSSLVNLIQNPETGEIGGPKGPEPTRHNDWHISGR